MEYFIFILIVWHINSAYCLGKCALNYDKRPQKYWNTNIRYYMWYELSEFNYILTIGIVYFYLLAFFVGFIYLGGQIVKLFI